MRRPTLRDRMFQSWWRVQRGMTLGVRGVICDAGGRVLLLRHTYTPGWHFPGGGVEKGETCMAALLREAHEEAGVLSASAPRLVSVHANHRIFPNDHILVFRFDDWTREDVDNAREIAEVGFFDPLAPPEGVTPGTQRRLREMFAGEPVREEW